jgi:hypothetical protein
MQQYLYRTTAMAHSPNVVWRLVRRCQRMVAGCREWASSFKTMITTVVLT